MLSIKNLSKSYKSNEKAIDNISFEINKGDIFGFIGHNGAGKTTTIKCIVGIHEFEEGEILIDKKDINKNPIECKIDIAYIPDNPDLYESLTGIQYLNFISNIFKVERKEREELINYYANRFEIKDNLGNLISSYSHGMKQKLAIISALIHKPKILILDEPFVGLDPKASFTLKEMMKEFCENGGAIFFSTHVLDVAEKICNKVAIIKNGKLVTSGYTDEVTRNKSLESLFMEMIEHE
ncbi:ABC transporter ATP-binding protein [Romboutsia sp. 1001713B170207_170306_H8]|uniref:ABC transporter ATP-binding protein n=1 Tax=Romboutsia sp. 1001713B170207_170306_H8 TaxID=2787112 RepID=UPI0018998261|nr:ABC transporter ATP-binding protein [Romboutsia sp. 1001713B170207_170306_H8]